MGILWNKYTIICIGLSAIQQLLIGSSNFWLVGLGLSAINGNYSFEHFIIKLTLYVLFLLLSELPASLSLHYAQISIISATQKYVLLFSKTHYNQTTLTAEDKFRKEQEVWLTTRSDRIIEDSLNVIYGGISLCLSVLFNVGSICLAANSNLLPGYLLSIFFMLLSTKYYKKDITILTTEHSNNKAALDGVLQTGWDNIVLGNEYNFKIWEAQFLKKICLIRNSAKNLLIKQFTSDFTTRIFIATPVILNIAWIIAQNTHNPEVLASLFATLPVQMILLPEIVGISAYLILLHKMKVEQTLLENSLKTSGQKLLKNDKVSKRIRWSIIKFYYNNDFLNFGSLTDVLTFIYKNAKGRVTLEGRNGSGKSTLFYLLKKTLKDKAIIIAPMTKLCFHKTNYNFSTGQKIKSQLLELSNEFIQSITPKIFLLDEWDANLDIDAVSELSQVLDKIAERHMIIEIRHKITKIEAFHQARLTAKSPINDDRHPLLK